jgi:hypothetical protein
MIDLNEIIANATAPKTAKRAVNALPSLAPIHNVALVDLTNAPLRSTADRVVKTLRASADPVSIDAHVTMQFHNPLAVTVLSTRSVNTTRKTPYALDVDASPAIFSPALPLRDPSCDSTKHLTRANTSHIASAVLTARLLDMTRTLTATRSLCIATRSANMIDDITPMLTPNTCNVSTVIIAYACAIRPSCDALTLALIDALHNALDLSAPTFTRPDDLPVIKLN